MEDIDELLDRIGVLTHPCHLDLLVFFARHPRSLVTSEQLAAWLGYDLAQVAESLEVLLGGNLLTRTQNRTHAARLYVLGTEELDDWFPRLLSIGSTRSGRLALREALARRTSKLTKSDTPRARASAATPRPRPFVVRRRTTVSDTKTG